MTWTPYSSTSTAKPTDSVATSGTDTTGPSTTSKNGSMTMSDLNLPRWVQLVYDDGDGLRVVEGTLTAYERVNLDPVETMVSQTPKVTHSHDPSFSRFTIDGEIHETRECKITWRVDDE